MKLARIMTVLGCGIGVAGALVFQGCSSDTVAATAEVGKPPAKPAGATPTTSTTEKNFALHTLLLGDIARGATTPTPTTAWKKFGYNIDGKVSTRDSADGCKLVSGASKTVRDDGENGIDNSFGANILPIVLNTAGAEGPAKINQAIADGSFTIMLNIKGLSDDPKQTATGLTGSLFAGGKFPNGKPTFTSADDWPVRPEILGGDKKDPTNSTIKFTDSYVVNGTWVNGSQSDVTISLVFSGVALDLTVHKASLTFDHTGPNKGDNGTIAGVVSTTELVEGLRKVAGRISTSLCGGSAFEGIAGQIKQASDIMEDGTAGAAASECNAISIGLGFSADVIGPPKSVADLGTPSADPCVAGADAGQD
jgi:hypothetical protein